VARSNEAKALGVGLEEPEFKIRDLLKRYNVAEFYSNYSLYGDISNNEDELALHSSASAVGNSIIVIYRMTY
jgi:hypothetical protein